MWPLRNLGLKAISVGIAVLLWMVVSGEAPVERGLRVPLELQQMPVGLELESELPALVDVRVRGGSTTLSRVAAGDIVEMLDVHTARPGQRLFPVDAGSGARALWRAGAANHAGDVSPWCSRRTATKRVPVVPSVDGTSRSRFCRRQQDERSPDGRSYTAP